MKRLLFFSLIFFAFIACASTESHDGHWWNSVSKGERTGFLAGYIDCAVYDTEQKDMVDASWNLLEPKITKFYGSNASDLKKPVELVLIEINSLQRPQKRKNGERYSEKHGIFDGEYWRQSLDDERLGFIEGYLVCQKKHNKPAMSFSRKPQWYAVQISKWYGIQSNDPSEINEKRSSKKIADVLYLFKDQEHTVK